MNQMIMTVLLLEVGSKLNVEKTKTMKNKIPNTKGIRWDTNARIECLLMSASFVTK